VVFGEEDVETFDVAVKDVTGVEVVEGEADLVGEPPDLLFGEVLLLLPLFLEQLP
jgi:hypothetical protein